MAQQTINNGESATSVRNKLNGNFSELYATAVTAASVANVAARDTTYPAASQPDGFRVKVASNQLVYVVRDGAYIIEDYEADISNVQAWSSITEAVSGQKIYVSSLKARYLWNGTSWEQDGCCSVGTEGAALITDDLPPVG